MFDHRLVASNHRFTLCADVVKFSFCSPAEPQLLQQETIESRLMKSPAQRRIFPGETSQLSRITGRSKLSETEFTS